MRRRRVSTGTRSAGISRSHNVYSGSAAAGSEERHARRRAPARRDHPHGPGCDQERPDLAGKGGLRRRGGEAGGEGAQEAAQQVGGLTDAAIQDVLAKEVKRRREAAELYRKANREDLAAAEEAEAAILGEYLPRQLTAEELRPLVAAAIAELGGAGPADMGKVMPALMQRFKGQADGRVISQVAREVLTQKQ
nr:MAG: hypothetical protein DIU80_11440 [Chloroflexota bacterium]